MFERMRLVSWTQVVDSNAETCSTLCERRERNRKARAAKKEMKNREKLKGSIQALLAALQAASKELSDMPSVLLVLGSSTKHPFAAYDIQFHRICPFSSYEDMQDLGKSSNLEIPTKSLSKKVLILFYNSFCWQNFAPCFSKSFFRKYFFCSILQITRALLSRDRGPLFTGSLIS